MIKAIDNVAHKPENNAIQIINLTIPSNKVTHVLWGKKNFQLSGFCVVNKMQSCLMFYGVDCFSYISFITILPVMSSLLKKSCGDFILL